MIAAIWIVAALALGCWTLCFWALWVLLSWDPAWVAQLKIQLEQWPGLDWLNAWWPDWDVATMTLLHLLHQVLAFAAQWMSWALGGIWLAGSLLGLGLAALLHALVRESGRTSRVAS
jgi:hypothetical protein